MTWFDSFIKPVNVFVGELNELVREKDLLALEKKCEHHATETAMNNAREMQKQAAKSAKDAGKNKGKSETRELLQEKKAERRVLMWNKQYSSQREGCDCDTHTPLSKNTYLPLLVDAILKSPPPPLLFPLGVQIKHSIFSPEMRWSFRLEATDPR